MPVQGKKTGYGYSLGGSLAVPMVKVGKSLTDAIVTERPTTEGTPNTTGI